MGSAYSEHIITKYIIRFDAILCDFDYFRIFFVLQTDEKTFLPVMVASERQLWTEIPGKFRTIQLERDRLSKLNRYTSKCSLYIDNLMVEF